MIENLSKDYKKNLKSIKTPIKLLENNGVRLSKFDQFPSCIHS